ncbi:septation inhibitor protein [Alkalihalobacillus alcalophilus ATCC 27647 = CGMCC 1.3604]|uniref:Probable septum site-determining protein MinC n=1 Tax=Alkalihalobacillus alcalophilus ATCC 27647 = CGMCC 1.3604 TaxID=1218173 RepID=A0A094XFN1_ALKAL|nr:septum formation inhibitor [Alkalihalobacillus alcalophilus ATCC 27647 = CGMCC 1.3604]THG92190.1 septation inhibitor protein [Alkalihalobacillus alcalophilus ATCC 27647 = CGMCC 1.3604]
MNVMAQKKQHVTIKGTKDGLMFLLDDHCGYSQLIAELTEKLSSKHYQNKDGPEVNVNVHVGNRYLTNADKEELREIITKDSHFSIEKIESNVLSIEEAEQIRKQSEMITLTKVIRSGQVLKVTGDLLLVGDVNPGGMVMATGNIYIMGALKGIAHAGFEGNDEAVISASQMSPSQLRIANQIYHFEKEDDKDSEMEAAFIDRELAEIVLEKVQRLIRFRPNLQRNEHQIIE